MGFINNPDGSEVSDVVLPDGASASEVIAPDGSVIWSAIPDAVVDNYEDDPDGPYGTGDDITTYYSGDTGIASRTTTNPIAGSYSLALETGGNDYIGSVSGDGLPAYPQYGDVLSFRVRFPATDWSVSHYYLASSNNSRDDLYGVRIKTDDSAIQITRYNGGSFSELTSASFTYSADTVYTIICGVRDAGGNDEHFAELYEKATVDRAADTPDKEISVNDSTHITDNSFDHQGIGFRTNTPGTNPYLVDDYWVRQ